MRTVRTSRSAPARYHRCIHFGRRRVYYVGCAEVVQNVPMNSDLATRAAERYVAVATSGGGAALADLFSDDAEFHNPRGGVVRGRESIRSFYADHLRGVTVAFHVGRSVAEGDSCWVELQGSDPDGQIRLIASNHFTVDEQGLITRLAVFLRPAPS